MQLFFVLILYSVTLLKSLISSRIVCMYRFLGIYYMDINVVANRNSIISSFAIGIPYLLYLFLALLDWLELPGT